MENKSAMQQMIDWLKETPAEFLTVGLIQFKAKELLEVEKKNIEDAWDAGFYFGVGQSSYPIINDYYSTKYNQK